MNSLTHVASSLCGLQVKMRPVLLSPPPHHSPRLSPPHSPNRPRPNRNNQHNHSNHNSSSSSNRPTSSRRRLVRKRPCPRPSSLSRWPAVTAVMASVVAARLSSPWRATSCSSRARSSSSPHSSLTKPQSPCCRTSASPSSPTTSSSPAPRSSCRYKQRPLSLSHNTE